MGRREWEGCELSYLSWVRLIQFFFVPWEPLSPTSEVLLIVCEPPRPPYVERPYKLATKRGSDVQDADPDPDRPGAGSCAQHLFSVPTDPQCFIP